MNHRIIGLPIAAGSFILIGSLEPTAFLFADATRYTASLAHTDKLFLIFLTGLIAVSTMCFAATTNGLRESARTLEFVLSIVVIAGIILGTILLCVYVLAPGATSAILTHLNSNAATRALTGTLGCLFAITSLLAFFGAFKPRD